MNHNQWIRKLGLVVYTGSKGLDLSSFRVVFEIRNADTESPNNATIRVYNLAASTVQNLVNGGEYTQVTLNAGYVNGNYGVIFTGTIKQFRVGKETATESYLDILAADGDIGYNQGFVNQSIAKGSTPLQTIDRLIGAMPTLSSDNSYSPIITQQNIPSIRGQVAFGMARARLRNVVSNLDATWSIQQGKIVVVPRTGYLPGEIVQINIANGLIGVPQQTAEGIKIRCLLNSRIRIGGLVQLNNDEIAQTLNNGIGPPIAYNQYGIYHNAALASKNGYYRAYVVEHEGDTRGNPWYTNLTCLAVDITAPSTTAVSGT